MVPNKQLTLFQQGIKIVTLTLYIYHHSIIFYFFSAPTLSLGINLRLLPYLRNTFPAGCYGVIPTSYIVRIALVLASTLNQSQAYLMTAVKGAYSGTTSVLNGNPTSEESTILNVTLLPFILIQQQFAERAEILITNQCEIKGKNLNIISNRIIFYQKNMIKQNRIVPKTTQIYNFDQYCKVTYQSLEERMIRIKKSQQQNDLHDRRIIDHPKENQLLKHCSSAGRLLMNKLLSHDRKQSLNEQKLNNQNNQSKYGISQLYRSKSPKNITIGSILRTKRNGIQKEFDSNTKNMKIKKQNEFVYGLNNDQILTQRMKFLNKDHQLMNIGINKYNSPKKE